MVAININMMKRMIFKSFAYVILNVVIFSCSFGQDQIIEPQAISRMMEAFKQRNMNVENVKAWRIQIEAFTDRRRMEEEKNRFERSFPFYSLEWEHDDPYYILKVKNMCFLRKLDALFVLNQIKSKYPQSILTIDHVTPDNLLNSMIF